MANLFLKLNQKFNYIENYQMYFMDTLDEIFSEKNFGEPTSEPSCGGILYKFNNAKAGVSGSYLKVDGKIVQAGILDKGTGATRNLLMMGNRLAVQPLVYAGD